MVLCSPECHPWQRLDELLLEYALSMLRSYQWHCLHRVVAPLFLLGILIKERSCIIQKDLLTLPNNSTNGFFLIQIEMY